MFSQFFSSILIHAKMYIDISNSVHASKCFTWFFQASILLLSPFFSSLILQVNLAPREFVTGMLAEHKSCSLFCNPVKWMKNIFCSFNIINSFFGAKSLTILGTGLAIFSCMPTTLSSGVALTQVFYYLSLCNIILSANILLYT